MTRRLAHPTGPKNTPVRINPMHLIGALLIASAGLVAAGPKQGGSTHGNGPGNHGVAANGHGNSDFGHRQGDASTRTRGSTDKSFGRDHKSSSTVSDHAGEQRSEDDGN